MFSVTLSFDSAWDAGTRELTGDLEHEADRRQETLQQHLRGLRDLHHLLHHPAAQRLPIDHEPAWHGAGPD